MVVPRSRRELVDNLENNMWYRTFVVGVGVPVYGISEIIVAGLGLQATTLYLVAVSMFYISVVDARGKEMDEKIEDLQAEKDIGRVLKWVPDNKGEPNVTNHFETISDDEDFGVGIFVEYSGIKAEHMWKHLLDDGDDIYLLLKQPTEAIDADAGETQKSRIISTLKRLWDRREQWSQINVVFYTYPATVRGRKLGKDDLYLGWYTFDKSRTEDTVWGHSNPMMYVTREHEMFSDLDDFFISMVAARLWEHGTTPADLYDTSPPAWLEEWVEKRDPEDRIKFLETISPAPVISEEFDIEITDEPPVIGARRYYRTKTTP